jgi:hypothetical protein
MNPYTGDSWAALQGGGHNLGEKRGLVTVRISKARDASKPVATQEADAAAVANGVHRARTTLLPNEPAA